MKKVVLFLLLAMMTTAIPAQSFDFQEVSYAPERTVFHSFSGDARMGRICKENGWYMSFSGTVSYKGNDGIREALALADPTRILVETDAPYLTPMPYRGRTNSPSMIPYTLRAMAQVRGCSVEEVARITRRNTRECYGI